MAEQIQVLKNTTRVIDDPMEMERLSLRTEKDEDEESSANDHEDLESNRAVTKSDQPDCNENKINEPVTLRGLVSGFSSLVRNKGIHCCSPSRVFLLLKFFMFNVCFITADIFTDVIGGMGLLRQGHVYWGTATLALPFLPFVAYSIGNSLSSLRTEDSYGSGVWRAARHLPFMQPISNFVQFLQLLSMDTDSSQNSKKVESIQRRAGWLGFYEAFLESGPQVILQLSIVFRFGYITQSQMVSMPLSLLSLCLAASKAYYHQRMEPLADPDPPFVWSLILVLPLYLIITLTNVFTWAVIFAHVRAFVVPMVVLSIINKWLLIKVFHVYSALTLTPVGKEEEKFETRVVDDLKLNSIFTSLLSPCVVGNHSINLLGLMGLSNSLCLGLWLQCTVLIVKSSPLDIKENPPVTYCFQESQRNITHGPTESDSLSWFKHCSKECKPYIRLCGDKENPMDFLLFTVIPTLNIMLLMSSLLCSLLQVLSGYANVFRLTHWLTLFKGGYLHRSLLCNLADNGNHVELAKILGMVRKSDTKYAVNRPDSRGNTPLHLATSKGYPKCVMVLLAHNARVDLSDATGKMPHHLAAVLGRTLCLKMICQYVHRQYVMAPDIFGKTALDYSIENHHKQCSKILLRKTIDQSSEDPNDNLLHLACQSHDGTGRVIKAVLKAEEIRMKNNYPSSRLLSLGKNSKGLTPLDFTAQHGHLRNLAEILLLLKTSKEDISILQDDEQKTPLHLAISARNLMCCVVIIDYESKRKDLFREMWGNVGETSEIRENLFVKSGLIGNLLRYAIQSGSSKACKIILQLNRDEQDSWPQLGSIASAHLKSVNFNLLIDSIKFTSPGVLQVLLEEIENLGLGLCSMIITSPQTPEWYPEHAQSGETSNLFPYHRRFAMKSLINLLQEDKNSNVGKVVTGFKALFHYMVEHGKSDMLEVFLSTCVKEPEAWEVLLADETGKLDLTVLELASYANKPESTKLILDYIKHFRLGVVLPVTKDARTWLLELCIKSNHSSVLRYLLECYASAGVDVATLIQDSVDKRTGHSLVYRAAKGGYTDCLRLLFKFGATPTALKSDKDGEPEKPGEDFAGMTTILYEAIKSGSPSLVSILLDDLSNRGVLTGTKLASFKQAIAESQLECDEDSIFQFVSKAKERRRTLIETAAIRGHTGVIAVLLKKGEMLLEELNIEEVEAKAEKGSLFYARILNLYKKELR